MIAQFSDIVISGATLDNAAWYCIGFTHGLVLVLIKYAWDARK